MFSFEIDYPTDTEANNYIEQYVNENFGRDYITVTYSELDIFYDIFHFYFKVKDNETLYGVGCSYSKNKDKKFNEIIDLLIDKIRNTEELF